MCRKLSHKSFFHDLREGEFKDKYEFTLNKSEILIANLQSQTLNYDYFLHEKPFVLFFYCKFIYIDEMLVALN